MIKKVFQFNKIVLGIRQRHVTKVQEADEKELSVIQLHEEVDEFENANNIVDSIDAIMDLIYFSIGVLYKLGLSEKQITLIFDIIHAANMKKSIGVKKGREGHNAKDAIKPKGWKSPEDSIRDVLKWPR